MIAAEPSTTRAGLERRLKIEFALVAEAPDATTEDAEIRKLAREAAFRSHFRSSSELEEKPPKGSQRLARRVRRLASLRPGAHLIRGLVAGYTPTSGDRFGLA